MRLLSTVIGLPRHGRQNSKKIGDEIPAPRSLLPAPRSRTSFSRLAEYMTQMEEAQRIWMSGFF
jgi:hypothetical protein